MAFEHVARSDDVQRAAARIALNVEVQRRIGFLELLKAFQCALFAIRRGRNLAACIRAVPEWLAVAVVAIALNDAIAFVLMPDAAGRAMRFLWP